MNSQSRKQRRAYELWLKKVDPIKYREWKANSQERGKQIHSDNVEKVRQSESEFYENMQTQMIDRLRNEGLSNQEIDEQVENWVKTIKIWGSDERPIRRRQLTKVAPRTDIEDFEGE
jgi:hypothetical protein